ncbi:MAG TPA: hypothetical protein VG317_02540 [Pseudonocardiaceae bacterium]|nr:hypothetical protein [Pseudonocardiaceae bacterium]
MTGAWVMGPATAQGGRLTRPGPFESTFGVAGEQSLRATGFVPVKQVLGATVFRLSTKGMWNCGAKPFAIGAQHVALEVPPMREAHAYCRRSAFERLAQECAMAGGDGVVGAGMRLTAMADIGHEYLSLGTAVRSSGRVRPPRPFVASMDSARFGALIRSGWVPCGMAVGVGVSIRHDDMRTRLRGLSMANQEIPAFTELVALARFRARQMLIEDCARIGAEGLVLAHNTMVSSQHECSRTAMNYLSDNSDVQDFMITVTMWGTGVVPFAVQQDRTATDFVLDLNNV